MSNSSLKESEGANLPEKTTEKLKGYQLNHLRSLAHTLKPVVLIGQKGVTKTVILSLEEALDRHELVKVKFIENKSKPEKLMMVEVMQSAVRAHFVGMVGHIATFYRPHPVAEKRKIVVPQRGDSKKTNT